MRPISRNKPEILDPDVPRRVSPRSLSQSTPVTKMFQAHSSRDAQKPARSKPAQKPPPTKRGVFLRIPAPQNTILTLKQSAQTPSGPVPPAQGPPQTAQTAPAAPYGSAQAASAQPSQQPPAAPSASYAPNYAPGTAAAPDGQASSRTVHCPAPSPP